MPTIESINKQDAKRDGLAPIAAVPKPARARRLVVVFLWAAVVIAVTVTICEGILAVVLGHQPFFQRLLGFVATRYSDDGIITPAGVELIRRCGTMLVVVGAVAVVGATGLAFSLRRLLRRDVIEELPSMTLLPLSVDDSGFSQRQTTCLAIVIVLLAAAIRLPRLFTSLCYDEIFTIQHFAKLSLLNIPFAQAESNNHILNSLFLHILLPFSSAEAVVRLPTYLAGLGSLWLFFLVGRALGGSLVGLFALLLAAVSPYHLWYSTLARGYMLGLLLSLVGVHVLLCASRPPHLRSLLIFGVVETLAVWAMPTVMLLPLGLLGWAVLSVYSVGRQLTGMDARTSTGLAWLMTAVSVIVAVGAINIPMVPYAVLRATHEHGIGGVWAEASEWIGAFGHGWWWVLVSIAVIVVGAFALMRLPRESPPSWQIRLLTAVWSFSGLLFLARPNPIRVHVLAFVGVIIWAAAGLREVVALASRTPPPVRGMARRFAVLLCVGGVAASSWSGVTAAANAVPFQDIRGAVRTAEHMLPNSGLLLTSGFAEREIAYYAGRPVDLLDGATDPSPLLARASAACYLCLHADSRETDPVFGFFAATSPPGLVLPGRDPIPVWCFVHGKPVELQAIPTHANHSRQHDS